MKKILSMMSLVLMLLAFGWSQQAVAKTVYFQPNSNWKTDGARFALYVFGSSGDQWNDFTAIGSDGVYQASFDDTTYPNMIFVRMNGGTTENNWDNKWNQSGDLTAPAEDNQIYRMYDGTWSPNIEDFAVSALFTYTIDFNSSITTTDPDFAVASNWGHIVAGSVTYSSKLDSGVDGSGCLMVYSNGNDLLVTPLVSGLVTIYAKPIGRYFNDTAFLKIFSLNEDGTAKGSLLATSDFSSKSNSEEWDFIPITVYLSSEQRIGIQGSQVYMDNFFAQSATIVPQTEMKVTKVANSDGATGTNGTNPVFNQNEEGNTTVTLQVTVENTGDFDLVAGETENYTLTLAQATSSSASSISHYFEDAPFAVPVNIAVGESATFDAVFTVPATIPYSGYTYFFVRENIKGKTSSSYRYAQIKEYASKFIFDKAGSTYYSSSSATTTPIDFGKIQEETTVNYEIYNSGSAPLTINSFTLPAPFTSDAPATPFEVAGGEKKVIAITMPYGTPGIFAGNLVINYTNFGKEAADYTLGISATILDASKNLITFSNADNTNGQFPAGSIHSYQVYITSKTEGDVTNYYLQSTSTTTKFITPLLTAAAGENFTFDAWYSSYSSSAAVTAYISTDRVNWTQITRATGLGSSVKTFTATIAEAGDYYLAFELTGNALLDNIYGLTLAAAPEHDWYITEEADIPSTGMQNTDYTASISLKNISADADNLTATLYMDGEAVATEEVSLKGNAKTAAEGTGRTINYSNIEEPTTVGLTFKPHTTGTLPTYIELKAGEYVLTSDEVQVTIAEEEAKSDATLATDGFSSNTPLNLYFKNSESVMLYAAGILKDQFGLNNGAKISSITFKGYGPDAAYTSKLKVWYQWVDDTEQTTLSGSDQYDTTGMTQLIDNDEYEWPVGGNTTALNDMIVLTFDEPLVYEEGKSLRIVVRSTSNSYKNGFYWEKSNISTYPSSGKFVTYRHQNDGTEDVFTGAWTTDNLPNIHLGLVVETTSYSGVVTDAITKAVVEGATVTLYDETKDVQYQGTTDAEGKFDVAVIQNTGEFTVTVTADGYADEVLADAVTFTEGSVADVAIALTPAVELTISESTYATFYYENDAYMVPEGLTAYTATKNGNTISLEDKGIYIPAGCPVVIHGEPGTYQFKWSDSSTSFTGDNDLVGSEEGGKDEETGYKYYVLSWKNQNKLPEEVGFYWQSGSHGMWASVKAHQAYMKVPEGVAPANGFSFTFDETTSVTTIDGDSTLDMNAPMYNLAGQRVGKDYRGVVIQNGKKVIKK